MKVIISADHPIFKRIDKIVDDIDARETVAELMKFNYDNIECNPYVPVVNKEWCGDTLEHNNRIDLFGMCDKCCSVHMKPTVNIFVGSMKALREHNMKGDK